ncbi:MAG: ATP-binding protein [Thermoleophilia bacterium]|nr:ATP-binding protein [Thermoleophilia bacterium]
MSASEITGDKLLHLVVPARAEYLSMLRLVVAAIASDSGFTDENIADIKVALSEASTNVVRHAYPEGIEIRRRIIEINCYGDVSQMTIEVTDHGSGIPLPPPASEGLGLGIMGSLMDRVDVETGASGTSVMLVKSPSPDRYSSHA